MTARKQTASSAERELGRELEQLQQSASVAAMIFRTDKTLYEHLAELCLWWRSANQIPGYLEAEYSKSGKKYKRKVKHGINFAPLFWLTWGPYNGLTDDRRRRWSIVLNKFNAHYESEKRHHTDSAEKLKNFLHTNGGVDGVVNDGKVTDDKLDNDGLSDEDAAVDKSQSASHTKTQTLPLSASSRSAVMAERTYQCKAEAYAQGKQGTT
jgi:hypothetical protein